MTPDEKAESIRQALEAVFDWYRRDGFTIWYGTDPIDVSELWVTDTGPIE